MNLSINTHDIADHLAEDFLADNENSKARLKLVFLAALFAGCWFIGSPEIGQAIAGNSSVAMLSTLLGM